MLSFQIIAAARFGRASRSSFVSRDGEPAVPKNHQAPFDIRARVTDIR